MRKMGLHNFTKNSDEKLYALLKQESISEDDVDQLSEDEKIRFNEITNELLQKAGSEERGELLEKIDAIVDKETKTEFWEYNHSRIMVAISSLIKEYGRMPSRSEIAKKAELSRVTIHKHLKEFASHPLYVEQLQKMRILGMNILSKVYLSAMDGDLGSRRLFLSATGFLPNTQIQNQNNFIQINNTILTQETIKNLNPEQLLIIEGILKAIILMPETITVDSRDNQEIEEK